MSYWNEVAVIAALILLNAVLSMSEAALVASRKARLQQLSNEGDHGSRNVLKLLEDLNVFLSTIVPTRDPSGPFGAKAAAEIPVDGVAPAVVNAIHDATGTWLREIPATPERVWRALRARRQSA